ncbi:MAG: hypothetical protein HPY69_16100 [Armatimonadetes bacterium]|nr:hypothetical protein [Armatimonadota bacterium]
MGREEEKLEADIRDLLAAGRPLDAIRLYRGVTGCGLYDAELAVDTLVREDRLPLPGAVPLDMRERVLEFLRQGRKLNAIILYRERTGVDLLTAKTVVEGLARHHGLAARSPYGLVLLVVLAAALVIGGIVLAVVLSAPQP